MKSKSSRGAPTRGKLCTNVCPVADLWMNCDELHDKWSGWLCKVRGRSLPRLGTIPHFWFAEPDTEWFFWFFTIQNRIPLYREIQGDHSGWAKPQVDIKTKIQFLHMGLLLKQNFCFDVNGMLGPT